MFSLKTVDHRKSDPKSRKWTVNKEEEELLTTYPLCLGNGVMVYNVTRKVLEAVLQEYVDHCRVRS